MKENSPPRVCAYCGEHEAALTDDHVPPKLFLVKPYPPDLPTVAACLRCNQSFMKDDEYVRTVLSRDTRAQSNLAAQLHAPVVERALARSATARFKEYLEANTTPSVILAADGNPMGQFMNIDETRMVAVGERLIRGLYFYEKCERVPNDAKVTVGWLAGLRSLDAEMLVIARPFTVLKDQRDRAFGDAFSYMAGFGPKASVWLLVLYDYIFWAGTILDADHAAIRPMKPSDESHSPRESGTSGWLGTAYW